MTSAAVAGARAVGTWEPVRDKLPYQPALDGLRGVALLLVIAYHFSGSWSGGTGLAAGGFLGVDAFFVLSGYFVTTLVLGQWARRGALDLAWFWSGRLRRIVPALGLVVLAVAVWAYFEADPTRLDAIRSDSLWAVAFGSNWHLIGSGQSYFDLFSEPSPFRHTWMLAVVVHFYLVWPLVMMACLKFARRGVRAVGVAAGAGAVASSLLLAALYDKGDPSRSYYGTDTRASELLIGALLATLLWGRAAPASARARRALQGAGATGAIAFSAAVVLATGKAAWLYYGGFLAVALAVAVVIVAVVQPGPTPLRAVLAWGPVRWIGLISFGLYLWHWPVRVALSEPRTGISGWRLTLLWIGVSLAAAIASYYLVEQPIRRGTRLRGSRARVIAAPTALAMTALVVVGATAGATAAPAYLTGPQGNVLHTPALDEPVLTTVAAAPNGTALPTRWLLVGDSIAASLGEAVQAEATTRGLTFSAATRPGCGLVTGIPAVDDGTVVPWGRTCDDETIRYLTTAVSDARPQIVLWLSTWETADRIVEGVLYKFGTPRADAMLLQKLDESRALLTATGAHLVLLTNPARAAESEIGKRDQAAEQRILHLNELFRQFAGTRPESVTIVDFSHLVCPTGPPCPDTVDGVRLRSRDGGHFEADGAVWIAARLLNASTDALSR